MTCASGASGADQRTNAAILVSVTAVTVFGMIAEFHPFRLNCAQTAGAIVPEAAQKHQSVEGENVHHFWAAFDRRASKIFESV